MRFVLEVLAELEEEAVVEVLAELEEVEVLVELEEDEGTTQHADPKQPSAANKTS